MKKLIIAFLLLTATSVIFAQKEFPDYGKVDKADLLLKECEFDKDADAYKLLDFGDVNYVSGKYVCRIETKRRSE